MKKGLALVLVVALAALIGACAPADNGEAPGATQYLSMATGGMAGVYYPLGGGMATVWNTNLDNVNVAVESTGASVANMHLIQGGDAELALTAANIAYDAAQGVGTFEGEAVEEVRAILSLYPEVVQVVVMADSGIESIADLEDKRVAVGDYGSGTELMAREILDIYGMSYDDIREDYLSFAEASTGLRDGTTDAAFIWAGIPTSGVMDLATTHKISLLEIEEGKLEELIARLPYCSRVEVPAGTYDGLEAAVTTVAIPAILAGHQDLDEDLVYEMLVALFENIKMVQDAHTRGFDITLETALDGMGGIPLHPGAERFFQEEGVL